MLNATAKYEKLCNQSLWPMHRTGPVFGISYDVVSPKIALIQWIILQTFNLKSTIFFLSTKIISLLQNGLNEKEYTITYVHMKNSLKVRI